MLNSDSVLNGDWSNSVPGRKTPEGCIPSVGGFDDRNSRLQQQDSNRTNRGEGKRGMIMERSTVGTKKVPSAKLSKVT